MSDGDDYLEEDGRTFTLDATDEECENNSSSSSAASVASPKSRDRGLDLNLSKAEESQSKRGLTYGDAVEDGIQEQNILVVFELPDGSSGEEQFKLGQTVEYLKQFVEVEYGIPMTAQRLFCNDGGTPMMDPLSLLDYPEAKGVEELFVRVEGLLPAECKK